VLAARVCLYLDSLSSIIQVHRSSCWHMAK
jgi:hypothetical protein